MNSDLILWGLTGYISFFVFQLARPVRNRSGWDFVAQVAFFTVVCVFLTDLIILLVKSALPQDLIREYYEHLDKILFHGKFRIILGCLLGVLIGALAGYTMSRKYVLICLSSFSKMLSGKERHFEFADTFFATCHYLLGKPVFLSLKNKKVYVGILIAATQDPNELQRFIKITPLMSGYRDEEHKVIFNTNYIFDLNLNENKAPSADRDILLPVSEVFAFSGFDWKIHEHFVKTGSTQDEMSIRTPPDSED